MDEPSALDLSTKVLPRKLQQVISASSKTPHAVTLRPSWSSSTYCLISTSSKLLIINVTPLADSCLVSDQELIQEDLPYIEVDPPSMARAAISNVSRQLTALGIPEIQSKLSFAWIQSWELPQTSKQQFGAIGLAAVSTAGMLRIYPKINLNFRHTNPRPYCYEIDISENLQLSDLKVHELPVPYRINTIPSTQHDTNRGNFSIMLFISSTNETISITVSYQLENIEYTSSMDPQNTADPSFIYDFGPVCNIDRKSKVLASFSSTSSLNPFLSLFDRMANFWTPKMKSNTTPVAPTPDQRKRYKPSLDEETILRKLCSPVISSFSILPDPSNDRAADSESCVIVARAGGIVEKWVITQKQVSDQRVISTLVAENHQLTDQEELFNVQLSDNWDVVTQTWDYISIHNTEMVNALKRESPKGSLFYETISASLHKLKNPNGSYTYRLVFLLAFSPDISDYSPSHLCLSICDVSPGSIDDDVSSKINSVIFIGVLDSSPWRSKNSTNASVMMTVHENIAYIGVSFPVLFSKQKQLTLHPYVKDENNHAAVVVAVSITPGVASDAQINACLYIPKWSTISDTSFLLLAPVNPIDGDPVVDPAHPDSSSAHESDNIGGGREWGNVFILHKSSITTISCKVPPPFPPCKWDSAIAAHLPSPSAIYTQRVAEHHQDSFSDLEKHVIDRCWLTMLQYQCNQKDSAKQMLFDMLNFYRSTRDHSVKQEMTNAMSFAFVNESDGILQSSPESLIINNICEYRIQKHNNLLTFLGDAFMTVEIPLPKLWNLISDHAKSVIETNAEKLEAATRLREIENRLAEEYTKNKGDGQTAYSVFEPLNMVYLVLENSVTSTGDLPMVYKDIKGFQNVITSIARVAFETIVEARSQSATEVVAPGISTLCDCMDCIYKATQDVRSIFEKTIGFRKNPTVEDWSNSKEVCNALRMLLSAVADVRRECGDADLNDQSLRKRSFYKTLGEKFYILTDYLMDAQCSKMGSTTDEWSQFSTKLLKDMMELDLNPFELAIKYRNFEILMGLGVDSSFKSDFQIFDGDFEVFLEKMFKQFGDEFLFFAFEWLESHHRIDLLLVRRPPPYCDLLEKYFSRTGQSNLLWILKLQQRDFLSAAVALRQQAASISLPAKANSFGNTKTLLSIAKLSIQAENSKETVDGFSDLKNDIDKRLYLLKAQERFETNRVMKSTEIVKKYIEDAPLESRELASCVSLALEVIQQSRGDPNMNDECANDLTRFVWHETVGREFYLWLSIIGSSYRLSDTEGLKERVISDDGLCRRLENTALFLVVRNAKISANEMKYLFSKGVFEFIETEIGDKKDTLQQLLQTTVQLAHQTKP